MKMYLIKLKILFDESRRDKCKNYESLLQKITEDIMKVNKNKNSLEYSKQHL